MAKKKQDRKVVRLVNPATGTAIYTKKNLRNTTEKLVLRKYDKKIRTQAEFTEVKKNLGRNEAKPRKH